VVCPAYVFSPAKTSYAGLEKNSLTCWILRGLVQNTRFGEFSEIPSHVSQKKMSASRFTYLASTMGFSSSCGGDSPGDSGFPNEPLRFFNSALLSRSLIDGPKDGGFCHFSGGCTYVDFSLIRHIIRIDTLTTQAHQSRVHLPLDQFCYTYLRHHSRGVIHQRTSY